MKKGTDKRTADVLQSITSLVGDLYSKKVCMKDKKKQKLCEYDQKLKSVCFFISSEADEQDEIVSAV